MAGQKQYEHRAGSDGSADEPAEKTQRQGHSAGEQSEPDVQRGHKQRRAEAKLDAEYSLIDIREHHRAYPADHHGAEICREQNDRSQIKIPEKTAYRPDRDLIHSIVRISIKPVTSKISMTVSLTWVTFMLPWRFMIF